MALTITEKYRASIGGKAWRCYEITDDDTTVDVTAAQLGMERIEFAMFSFGTFVSAPAANVTMTVAADGSKLTFSEVGKIASKKQIMAIGW